MDCLEAREAILDSPDAAVGDHVALCEACRRFLEEQQTLDAQLSQWIAAPRLSANFREPMMAQIRVERARTWTVYLPDAAHFVGCAGAILVCLWKLPFEAGLIVANGFAFTIATYLVQTFVRRMWEAWEEGG